MVQMIEPLKDQIGDQGGGSEWEPIEILLKEMNSSYDPKPTPKPRTLGLPNPRSHWSATRPRDKTHLQASTLGKYSGKQTRVRSAQ